MCTAVDTTPQVLGRQTRSGQARRETVLTPVADAARPARAELIEAARADPYGPLAAALTFLFDANDRLDEQVRDRYGVSLSWSFRRGSTTRGDMRRSSDNAWLNLGA
jgi:hypothetical protein